MSSAVHMVHVLLAGVWLGGVLFTSLVVSPAFKAVGWPEAERVAVRSVVGRHYAPVAVANLGLWMLFAVWDGLAGGLGAIRYAEWALLPVLLALVAAHGAYFGPRMHRLAETERDSPDAAGFVGERRRSLQRLSLRVSGLNLLVSLVGAVLAAGG